MMARKREASRPGWMRPLPVGGESASLLRRPGASAPGRVGFGGAYGVSWIQRARHCAARPPNLARWCSRGVSIRRSTGVAAATSSKTAGRAPDHPRQRLPGGDPDTYQRQKWGSVRVIKDRNLLLMEEGIGRYLVDPPSPSQGYRLAVTYCQNYDPRYGQDLNGPSRVRLEEICSFIRDHVAQEGGNPPNPRSPKKKL
jgi:hypothetical protein